MKWWIVAIALVVACSSNKPPSGPDRPAGVLATVSRGSMAWMDNARTFANAVRPGAGLMLNDALISSAAPGVLGVTSLDGVDRNGPIHVVIVDQGKGLTAALVAKISEESGFEPNKGTAAVARQGDWAVIGPKPVVDAVSGWAFATLANGTPKPGLTAKIYAPEIMKVYGGHIDRFRTAALGQLGGTNPALQRVLQLYADAAMAIATDADTIDVSIDMAADLATIDLAIVPKANSELASFVGVQTPSELGMIDKLPGTPAPPLLVAGKLALGPYHAGFRGMVDVFYASMATTPDVATAIEGVMGAASGSFALTWRLDPTGAVLTQVLALDDPGKANSAVDKGLAAVAAGIHDAGPAHLDYASVPPTQHEGFVIRGYGVGPANGPTAQVLLSTVDRTLVVASGPGAEDRIGTTIDVARGKAGHFIPPPTWTTMIERAKKDRDSVAIVLDIARMGASPPDQVTVPMLVGIGFDTAVHVHLAVPPSVMRAFMP